MALSVSVSSRIRAHLRGTNEFTPACTVVFNYCLSLNQHASAAVINHLQLCAAVDMIYHLLSRYLRGFRRLHPRPPCRHCIMRVIILPGSAAEVVLGAAEFEDLALEIFAEAIVWKIKRDVAWKILRAAVAIGVPCMLLPSLSRFFATVFVVYCLGIGSMCMLALRFSFIFFRL